MRPLRHGGPSKEQRLVSARTAQAEQQAGTLAEPAR